MDSIIKAINDAVPADGNWSAFTESFVEAAMTKILMDTIGKKVDIVEGHIGDEDDTRYDLDFENKEFTGNFRTVDLLGKQQFELFVQVKHGYGYAVGPDKGIQKVSEIPALFERLCEEARKDEEGYK